MTVVVDNLEKGEMDGRQKCTLNKILFTRHPFLLSPLVDHESSLRGGTTKQSVD
jgi:hypothetical protein